MPAQNIVDTEIELQKIIRSMKTIAVVGMKGEQSADLPAFQIPQILHRFGYKVIPVNPTIQSALGQKGYPNLAAIGHQVDVINIFRRSDAVEAVADEILALPKDQWPTTVWMQTGIRNDAAAEKLSNAGIQVVMDRCISVYASRFRGSIT